MEVRRKDVQKRTLIDTPCESNIKTVVKEHFLPENVHSVGQQYEVTSYIPSTSSQQIVEQTEVIQEVSPEVTKVNHSVMNKKHGDRIQFPPEKRLQKKENGFITCRTITPVNGLLYKIIDSSILQKHFLFISKQI